jgi:hypothetical protein
MNQGFGPISNYSGRLPDVSANIKNFVVGPQNNQLVTIKNINGQNTVTFSAPFPVLISSDLTVVGSITAPSDVRLKTEINPIKEETVEQLLNLEVKEFIYKDDTNKQKHFGLIAQDVETKIPEIVFEKNIKDNKEVVEDSYKTVNYLELIPLLVYKIQDLQKQIDKLKEAK